MSQLQRIAQGRSAPLTHTFLSGGVATDPNPDSATYTITRADGTVLVTSSNATEAGTGAVTVTVTPAQTALLDTWTVTWTATFGGQAQPFADTVEVAGGFLCGLDELGTVITGKTAAQLAALRVKIEQRIEKALRYACVPRYSLETRYSRAGDVLTRHGCRAVRSLTVIRPNMADWTLSAGQIANLAVEPWGVRGVPAVGPVLIGYEHGRDYVDSDIEEACLLLADEAYGASTLDGRVVSQSADNMAVTYASGSRGPFVNARLNQIIRTNRLPGVA
jgi:hypothetical protein